MSGGEDVPKDDLFETAEQEVMSFLPEMNEDGLLALFLELGLELTPDIKGRKSLYRFALAYLLQMEQDEEDHGKAKYLQIHSYFRELERKRTAGPNVEGDLPAKTAQKLEVPEVKVEQKVDPGLARNNQSARRGGLRPTTMRPPGLYHLKEFKIKGTIGDPGEKDKLDYYGLLAQLNTAMNEGYSEDRIVAAIINAISPGNVFKSRLEMRRNLEGAIPIETLKKMLRTHYQEIDSQSIFAELTGAVQSHDESAAQFTNRLIVIRDKALSRSMEEGCEMDGNYLNKRFLKSVGTGMRNGNLRNALRENIKADPEDDDLLELIAEAVRNESERTSKLTQLKTPEVLAVSREKNDFQREKRKDSPFEKIEEMKVSHQKEIGSLRAELSEIKNVLKAGFSNLPPPSTNLSFCNTALPSTNNQRTAPTTPAFNGQFTSPAPPAGQYVVPQLRGGQNNLQSVGPQNYSNNQRRRFRGCVNCVAQNNRWCDHCLLCGGGDHRVSNCPNRPPPGSAAPVGGQSVPVQAAVITSQNPMPYVQPLVQPHIVQPIWSSQQAAMYAQPPPPGFAPLANGVPAANQMAGEN